MDIGSHFFLLQDFCHIPHYTCLGLALSLVFISLYLYQKAGWGKAEGCNIFAHSVRRKMQVKCSVHTFREIMEEGNGISI